MAVDIFILVLPIPVVWSLQMTFKRRLAVITVITTGGLAVITSGLRAIILFEFARSPNFTWALGKMIIISAVEIEVGIVAANMPSIKAFYSSWRGHTLTGSRSAGSHARYGQSGSNGIKLSNGDVEMQSGSRGFSNSRKTPDPMALTMSESEEKLWESRKRVGPTTGYESSMQSGRSVQ